jgi:hypothetical protein
MTERSAEVARAGVIRSPKQMATMGVGEDVFDPPPPPAAAAAAAAAEMPSAVGRSVIGGPDQVRRPGAEVPIGYVV